MTGEGLKAALKHVRGYEFGDVEVLTHPDLNITLSDRTPVRKAPWVPKGTAVVLPVEREFVGVWGRVSRKDLVAVVHNAARGVAIATGGFDDVSGDNPRQP